MQGLFIVLPESKAQLLIIKYCSHIWIFHLLQILLDLPECLIKTNYFEINCGCVLEKTLCGSWD
jgi:hypothetical protein